MDPRYVKLFIFLLIASIFSCDSQDEKVGLQGVTLYEPLEVTGSSVKLSWSRSQISDFLEYKLYRHSTSGLDEATGVLVHVATNVNDTVFTENGLTGEQTYFYRVFVHNTFGLSGGSNIREVKTKAADLVQNGNLENGMTNWELFTPNPCASVAEDPTAPYGSKVIKFEISNSSKANISSDILQTINHTKFVAGQTYRLSLSLRTESLPGTSVFYAYLMHNADFVRFAQLKVAGPGVNEWTTYSVDFIAPNLSAPVTIFLYLEPVIPYNNELILVYADGISVTRQ